MNLERMIEEREAEYILDCFLALLEGPTFDGQIKRRRGEKVLWTVDPEHRAALYRHLRRFEQGLLQDADSGSHPLVHVAWRCLALAWQQTQGDDM